MINRRLIPSVWVSPDVPSLAGGRPASPRFQARYTQNWTVRQGVGHIRVAADPDPVWDGSAWTTEPPSGATTTNFIRWSARTLPLPSQHGGEYFLGQRTGFDGTGSLPVAANQWDSAPGSSFGVSWQSAYPFKPRVQPYTHHGHDGTTVTTPAAVFFHPHMVEHMWADFASVLTPPFTFMIVCVFPSFPGQGGYQCVLDSGRDPTTGTGAIPAQTRQSWYSHGVPARTALPENLGYRTGLWVQPGRVLGFSDQKPTTRMARVPFAYSTRPKVIYGVYNGASSIFGYFGNSLKYSRSHIQRAVKLANHGSQRFAVLGRSNGVIDSDRSSAMVVFEIRLWNIALSDYQLVSNFDQLASTWRFPEHV